MDAFAVLVAIVAAFLCVPALVFFVVCVASVLLPSGRPVDRPEGISLAVLVPAHDEAEGIGRTIAGLRSQLAPGDRVLVVADNCADDTAAHARTAGAEVIERLDAGRRGKGYALAYGIDHLQSDPPDVVIIVDADCSLAPGCIDALVQCAARSQRPVQSDYALQPAENTPISMISSLAMLVRNRVRSRGWHRLGQPCHLAGTGMAFPWNVLRAAPELGANLVEDLVMGIELALQGHEPLLCPEAGVRSELPRGRRAALQQRRRWEHGQLATLLRYGPRLIGAGLRRGRPGLLALGADLMVPPLALLVGLFALVLGLAGLLVLLGGPTYPAWIAGAGLLLVALGVILLVSGYIGYGGMILVLAAAAAVNLF